MQAIRRQERHLVSFAAAGILGLAAAAVIPVSARAAVVTTTIAEVQGTGDISPLDGTTVTVEGVMTADHRAGGYRGLYVQTAGSGVAEDLTPGASDGVFVYLGSRTTTGVIGDLVQVTGVVTEYYGLTEISASGSGGGVEVVSSGNALPTPVPLPDTVQGADREQYEGMLVDPEGTYLVASTHEVDRYGSVWLSAGATLPVKSTELARPGTDADAIAAANAAARIVLDDGRSSQVTGATQPYLTADDPVRVGDGVDFGDEVYVLHYGYDLWRLQPTTPIDATTPADAKASFPELSPRPVAPAEVGGDLTVATFNVLNYFTTFSDDDDRARGAEDAAQLGIQRGKIVAAIGALDADVVALQEIENSVHFGESTEGAADGTPDVALADLVAGLNAAAGSDEWAYVPTPDELVGAGAPATDVIMNAIIYRTDSVTTVGESVADVDETVWDIAREPIAQAFAPVDGAPFVVIANHFKSKSPPSGNEDPEPADGQGFFNAERVEQAEALVDFVAEMQAAAGTDDVAVLGDLNSYAKEDPVQVLVDAGLVDLVPTLAPGRYTYTYDGEQGSFDHALATPSFKARVTGADVWDINADEWFGFQYQGSFPEAGTVYRASDHDPIVLGLSATKPPVTIDLLGIGDFHGRIEAGGSSAGAAVLAGAVDAFEAANPNTLLLSVGDNIGASTFTSFVQDDVPTIDALNAMGLDVSALGNHEFDQGRSDVDDRVLGLADFPYVSADIYDRATGKPAYQEYALAEVDGVTVGFIGATTQAMPTMVTPAGVASVEMRPVVDEANRVAGELSDGDEANGEADVLVLLVHEGPESADVADATDDSVFGRIVTGVSDEIDAIYAGHTHLTFTHLLPVEGWAEGLNRPVIGSGQYGETLSHVTLSVDATTGDVVSSFAELIPLAGAYPPDPTVAAIVADATAVATELGSVSLGRITGDFDRARQSDGTTENRGGESTLGNLVADVQLWATRDAGTQIAFMNPGGLRANLTYASTGETDPDGNVTYQEAANVQPFANTLTAMTLTGRQVIDVLEQQWQPAGASRPFLKLGVAGITYTYDPTAASGDRITQVWVAGIPIDLAAEYTVVVNSFLASGGDNFAAFAQGTDRTDSGRVDLQAFADYLAARSPLSPDLAQRAVGVHVTSTAPEAGYLPGDTVTADLSSLLFSAGDVQGDQVVVSIAGAEVAASTVDPAIVDKGDEVGRASVTFTVPADAPGGDLEVAVTVPGTGTTTSFTIPVREVARPSCTVDYQAVRLWPRILLGAVTVTNTGPDPVEDWRLTWQFADGERARLGVGATVRQQASNVTATSWWNTTLDPEESTTFGFLGTAPRGAAAPTGLALNGVECTVE
jgi:5'-nucleotidase